MPGFKALKDRPTLSLGANAVGDFKLKPVLIYHSGNPRALKNYAKSTLPVLYKWKSKSLDDSTFVYNIVYYSKSIAETYCSEKRFLSKYYCSLTMHLVTSCPWRWTMGFMLFSFLQTLHLFCSPWIKD